VLVRADIIFDDGHLPQHLLHRERRIEVAELEA
jgi:hypothetical protein